MGEPETGEQRPETGKWNALREREPRKTQRGRDATKRHLKRKDAKTQRSGRIHEERKKAGKDLLAEPDNWREFAFIRGFDRRALRPEDSRRQLL